MTFIGSEELKSTLGAQADGPAGFGVHYEIKGGAEIKPDTNTVDAHLNEQSLATAKANLEGGSNKEVAASLAKPKPTVGSALAKIDSRRDAADSMYGNLFAKHGLQSAVSRRSDHRSVLAPTMASTPVPKNPLQRIRQRQLLQLRKTFDDITQRTKKPVALNPETLPQSAKERMIEAALKKGETNTPLGPIPSAVGAVKTVGKLASAWAKWDAVGALAAGSFIDLSPKLKRN